MSLCKACPYLERFIFSNNLVDDVREIIPLGKLRFLMELEFRSNPVVNNTQKHNEVRERVQREQAQLTDKLKAKFP
jgi:hypothetical protein